MIDSKYFSLPAPVSTSLGRGCFFTPCPPRLACDVYAILKDVSDYKLHTQGICHIPYLHVHISNSWNKLLFLSKNQAFLVDFFLKASHLSETWLSWQNKQVVLSLVLYTEWFLYCDVSFLLGTEVTTLVAKLFPFECLARFHCIWFLILNSSKHRIRFLHVVAMNFTTSENLTLPWFISIISHALSLQHSLNLKGSFITTCNTDRCSGDRWT